MEFSRYMILFPGVVCVLWSFSPNSTITIAILQVLEDVDIPQELNDMFISIPLEKFCMDISSTEIRKSKNM